ncbi:retrovirus-related pol polyprotein from transposon TNT 1-94 [Tanacetum coccineum]
MCMFALTVSTAEPKNIKEPMADSAWIEAMQEDLHQFDKLQVWELVDKPFRKNVIKLKWLWKNKKDEDQSVIRNKARLVAKCYAQEDGQGSWEKYWKDCLRLGIFINQAKYALEILKKHGMEKGQSIGTPMATKPKLDADLSGEPVDQTKLTRHSASRVPLTWDSRSSDGFWSAFSDADPADGNGTRKSNSGGIQFLGDKLVNWMSKKQDCTVMSSAEAKYVALSASCAQVMWMRTQLKDYGLNYNKIPLYCVSQSAITISCNPTQHSSNEYQLADMFTKALAEDSFQYLVRRIGMRCLTPAELEVLTNESA